MKKKDWQRGVCCFVFLDLFSVTIILEVIKMKRKFELVFLVLAVVLGLSGIVSADISSSAPNVSSLGDLANEFRVDADQPENTNNCSMNNMEGSKAPDTPLEDPSADLATEAPEPFVEDVWDVANPVQNDEPPIPSPPYYPDNYEDQPENPPANIPEPATLLIFCVGMCGLLPFSRRKHSKKSEK
ncbi:MAG: PEP-CTERM sorting domain-containing protein [Planctomycetaceae bacterium]|nr:PEP-CTERM sorting domain-containing protein [Planctomycetaceae bacterium]